MEILSLSDSEGRGGDSVAERFKGEGWRFCPRVIQRGGVEILSLSDSEGRGGDSVPERFRGEGWRFCP